MPKLSAGIVKTIIEEYLRYGNYAENSIKSYLFVLQRFDKYLLENGVRDYRDVRKKNFYGFIKYLKDNSRHGIGKIGLNGYSVIVRNIFRILEKEEKIFVNPFGDCGLIKTSRNIRDKILSEEEISNLLNGIDISKPRGFRDRTILELLYGAGLRPGEMYNLELQDFIKDEKLIFVRQGKGKKDRVTPLGVNTFECLLKYIENIRPKLLKRKGIKYLFFNGKMKKLDGDALNYIIRRAKRKIGFKKKINPHMIRHTFATHLLNGGADIREVQLLLGHGSIKATEIYLNLSSYHLKGVYEKYHPLENELFFDVFGREGYIFANDFPVGIKLKRKKELTGI